MPAPWVAGEKPFKGQPPAFERPVFLNGLKPVRAARGGKTALVSEQGRYGSLVKTDKANKKYGKYFFHSVFASSFFSRSIPFVMASFTFKWSGIAASVKIRNK